MNKTMRLIWEWAQVLLMGMGLLATLFITGLVFVGTIVGVAFIRGFPILFAILIAFIILRWQGFV